MNPTRPRPARRPARTSTLMRGPDRTLIRDRTGTPRQGTDLSVALFLVLSRGCPCLCFAECGRSPKLFEQGGTPRLGAQFPAPLWGARRPAQQSSDASGPSSASAASPPCACHSFLTASAWAIVSDSQAGASGVLA